MIATSEAAPHIHVAALARHAAAVALIAESGEVAADLAALSALHPGLAPLANIVPDPVGCEADVTDPLHRPDGYRLGDLYQELSVEARRDRALCQTPKYVTDLLLDLALDHAYAETGPHIRMIDPACGTGHILIEALLRIHTHQQLGLCRSSRDTSPRLPLFMPALDRVQIALDSVHGVDVDPYAVLVTRYRLLVMAVCLLRAAGHDPSAAEIAGLPLNVACADALLADDEPILRAGGYDVVIANPPFITPKNAADRDAIRTRYRQVCSGQYSLALPFHARMHQLLRPGGWCAQLTASSFMKREFGKRYVEEWLANVDLRWVIDTSGAYIPSHGTPTVILVTRNQPPTGDTVHTIRGRRGEPKVPDDPARGLVWRDIEDAVHAREAYARLAWHFRG